MSKGGGKQHTPREERDNLKLFIVCTQQYQPCSCVYCNSMKIKVIVKNNVPVCFHAFSLVHRSVYCNVYSFCVCRGLRNGSRKQVE